MAYQSVIHPVPGPRAFQETSEAAILSQAAVLLFLGAEMRGDARTLMARAAAFGREGYVETIPREDIEELQPPRVVFTGERTDAKGVEANLTRRYGENFFKVLRFEGRVSSPQEVLADLGERLYREPSPDAAAELMEVCLAHPDELVRVAAAAAYADLSSAPEQAVKILEQGTYSREEVIREVAATALAQTAPRHPRLSEDGAAPTSLIPDESSHTTAIIHGTNVFGVGNWWQPGGNFHSYLGRVLPTLLRTSPWSPPYPGADRFAWTGRYSETARALGALDLLAWVDEHDADGLDVFAHSHGGSVAMLANASTLNVREMVLLSCPVHPAKYFPNFKRVHKVVSIRLKFDLVILADRGGQRFQHPQIEENVLPFWFVKHSDTHEPDVWMRRRLPAVL